MIQPIAGGFLLSPGSKCDRGSGVRAVMPHEGAGNGDFPKHCEPLTAARRQITDQQYYQIEQAHVEIDFCRSRRRNIFNDAYGGSRTISSRATSGVSRRNGISGRDAAGQPPSGNERQRSRENEDRLQPRKDDVRRTLPLDGL
jgi:hypothetical protein